MMVSVIIHNRPLYHECIEFHTRIGIKLIWQYLNNNIFEFFFDNEEDVTMIMLKFS